MAVATGHKEAPASLLSQAKAGAGMALLGMSAAVLLWAGAVGVWTLTNARPMAAVAMKDVPLWQSGGAGDDVTEVWDTAAGTYRIAWEAPCIARMVMNRWDGTNVTRDVLLGVSRAAAVTIPVAAGSYYFDVQASCDWSVSVSRT